jgi:hypothetical protein
LWLFWFNLTKVNKSHVASLRCNVHLITMEGNTVTYILFTECNFSVIVGLQFKMLIAILELLLVYIVYLLNAVCHEELFTITFNWFIIMFKMSWTNCSKDIHNKLCMWASNLNWNVRKPQPKIMRILSIHQDK